VTTPPSTPLARLLGIAFRLLIDDLHRALVEQGWTDVRESYGFVLLAIRDQNATVTELANLLGVSKQATSKLLDAMEDSGYVTRDDADHDGRAKTVALASRGRDLLAVVEAIYADLETQWSDVIGRTALEHTRTRLERIIRQRHDDVLPPIRPTPV
jgi:DNA-binding MarR family transcriptional regulator